MFKPYDWQGTSIGFAKSIGDVFVFFGNRNISSKQLPQAFPQFKFYRLKQIHSNTVIERSENIEVADAHFTKNTNEALIVQTADCMPILLSGKDSVAACHAGWRGLAANIIPLTMTAMGSVEHIFFGPHIGPQSFEVGVDVADEILNSVGEVTRFSELVRPHKDPAKRYVNLAEVAKAQIHAMSPQGTPTIEDLNLDTKSNLGFHSFRRDGTKAERQYGFIARFR